MEVSPQSLFETFLAHQGKNVEIARASASELIEGTISYPTVDGVLIFTKNSRIMVPFSDIIYWRVVPTL